MPLHHDQAFFESGDLSRSRRLTLIFFAQSKACWISQLDVSNQSLCIMPSKYPIYVHIGTFCKQEIDGTLASSQEIQEAFDLAKKMKVDLPDLNESPDLKNDWSWCIAIVFLPVNNKHFY